MSAPNDPNTGRPSVDAAMYSVEFKPRAGARRFVGMVLLVSLAATAYAGWLAYEERTTVYYGVAATLTALSLILWAAWATSPVSHVHVHGGVLEVRRAGKTERFDLTSSYTKLRILGTPRSSRWKVLIDRPSKSPFVIDRTIVDPKAFTRLLEAYHHVA